MKKIRFIAEVCIYNYPQRSNDVALLDQSLRYGSKHQDLYFDVEEILSSEEVEGDEEDDD